MNNKQAAFLRDLADLFDKYDINRMAIDGNHICFISNGEFLNVAAYDTGSYEYVSTQTRRFKVREEEEHNENLLRH